MEKRWEKTKIPLSLDETELEFDDPFVLVDEKVDGTSLRERETFADEGEAPLEESGEEDYSAKIPVRGEETEEEPRMTSSFATEVVVGVETDPSVGKKRKVSSIGEANRSCVG